jgi:tetratricopeptide (TPR) repeat protein
VKEPDWLNGRATLGAVAGWKAEEIRLIADLGHALASHGRNDEALQIFLGLSALAPATGYFQSALGALYLRLGDYDLALFHLNTALNLDPRDLPAYVNRGETYLRLDLPEPAKRDLRMALAVAENYSSPDGKDSYLARAKALLAFLSGPALLSS